MGKRQNCYNYLEALNPVYHLKARLVLAFAATTILLSVLLLVVITFTVEKTIRDNVGRQLGELAIQTADKLDRGMFERQRDIYLASNLPIYRDPTVNVSDQRDWLNKERDSLGYYAWLGFTNATTGIVRAAAGGILEGVNVTTRDWFQNALKYDSYIGDVHNAILLATILKNTSTEPLRFIDVAFAVKDENNVTIGILAAHIYSTYFREVESSILDSRVPEGTQTLREQSIELYILNSENVIISAPLVDNVNISTIPTLNMTQIQKSLAKNEYFFEATWPNETTTYVIGISDCIGYRTYAGLKWIILMRQPKSIAYASLLKIQLQIGLIGAGLALVFSILGFVIATKIVNPILRIVNSANRIMSDLPSVDESSELTESHTPTREFAFDLEMASSKDDVGILFDSLRNLVRSLDKEQELKVLNGKLEKKVRERTVELTTANQQLEHEISERGVTEAILLNMMPQSIVTRIKKGEKVIADQIDNATVFFSDIVGFTDISAATSAPEIVDLLNQLFSIMDDLAAKHNIEKIKTIGDAYFAVSGLFPIEDLKKEEKAIVYASKMLDFSIDVFNALDQFNNSQKFKVPINFRVGLHSGPAVAGIIGFKKPFFDLWGDTINTASRMEHYGSPGRIHVSQATYELTSHIYDYELRGEIEVKGKGEMRTYWLLRKKRTSARALTKVASLFNL